MRLRRLLILLAYGTSLLLLACFYLPIHAGAYVFWRNWFRAGCGPAYLPLKMNLHAPNGLAVHGVAFAVLWLVWLMCVCRWPLNRLPLALHACLGFLWCFAGCSLTLAI